MTSPKHSPAPWKMNVTRSPASILDANSDCIAKVYLTDYKTKQRDQTHVANANLIVAAPELLSALRDLIGQKDFNPARLLSALHLWDAARAAIAKAEV